MTPTVPSTILRDAKPTDIKALGELHNSALADNKSWNLFWGTVEPEVAEKWLWEGVSNGTVSGTETVRVLERIDTHELMGVMWYSEVGKEEKEELWRAMPEGFNEVELQKVLVPIRAWQTELLKRFECYICESPGRKPDVLPSCQPSLIRPILVIEEFAIAPSYQSRGYGKMLLEHVIEAARFKGLGVALTAAPSMSALRPASRIRDTCYSTG
jgi:ribosomal protein S18 acetylase RimI-like enzyme